MAQANRYKTTITELNLQRERLGMSYAVLAKKSGVSQPTVARILSGEQPSAHFDHVLAIADALGVNIQAQIAVPANDILRERAHQKALQLVGLVQGTSAMEAQAVDQETLASMIATTEIKLLAGSPRNLWAD